jgi:hypothetical protein
MSKGRCPSECCGCLGLRAVVIALAELAVDRVPLLMRMKAVLALMLLCLLASCAGLRSNAPSNLVGEWRYADRIQACRYVFNRDGSFEGDVVYRTKLISKFKGRWSVRDDVLLYKYVSERSTKFLPARRTGTRC